VKLTGNLLEKICNALVRTFCLRSKDVGKAEEKGELQFFSWASRLKYQTTREVNELP